MHCHFVGFVMRRLIPISTVVSITIDPTSMLINNWVPVIFIPSERLAKVPCVKLSKFCHDTAHYHIKDHLKCICTSGFRYFRKTGSPSHNFSVVKKLFKTCNPPDFKFYFGVMLILSLFSLQ